MSATRDGQTPREVALPAQWPGRGEALVFHVLSPQDFVYPNPLGAGDSGAPSLGRPTQETIDLWARTDATEFLRPQFVRNHEVYQLILGRHQQIRVVALGTRLEPKPKREEDRDTEPLLSILETYLTEIAGSEQRVTFEPVVMSTIDGDKAREVAVSVATGALRRQAPWRSWVYIVSGAERELVTGVTDGVLRTYDRSAHVARVSSLYGQPAEESRLDPCDAVDVVSGLLAAIDLGLEDLALWLLAERSPETARAYREAVRQRLDGEPAAWDALLERCRGDLAPKQ